MQSLNNTIGFMEEQSHSSQSENRAHSSPLTTHVVNDITMLSSLHEEWNTLALESHSTIYQTHEWQSLWWKHFGAKEQRALQVIIFRNGETLIGIAPMFSQSRSLFGITLDKRLSLMGCGSAFSTSFGFFLDDGPSDYLDIIVKPGFEEDVSSLFIEHLHRYAKSYSAVEFVNLKETSFVVAHLLPHLKNSGMTCHASQADICPYLDIPSSFDVYFQQISASVRRRLQQARKAAMEQTLFALREAHTLDNYKHALDNLIRLHQQRWNRMGYPGLFSDSRFKQFQYDVLEACYRNNWLWCATAEGDGKCVAGRYAFKFNNTYYDYLSGFDDSSPAAKRRPGLALLIAMLEEATKKQSGMLDLLRGDEQYKFELTSTSRYNWNLRFFPSQKKPGIVYRLLGMGSLVRFLLAREVRLLRVQSDQHRFPTYFIEYAKFRLPLFTRKIKGVFHKPSEPANSTHQQTTTTE